MRVQRRSRKWTPSRFQGYSDIGRVPGSPVLRLVLACGWSRPSRRFHLASVTRRVESTHPPTGFPEGRLNSVASTAQSKSHTSLPHPAQTLAVGQFRLGRNWRTDLCIPAFLLRGVPIGILSFLGATFRPKRTQRPIAVRVLSHLSVGITIVKALARLSVFGFASV